MKNKKLTIRITESQFKRLSDRIIEDNTTKSRFLRNLIEESDNFCRKSEMGSKPNGKSRFNLLDIVKRKKL
jgi:hypothetical protein